MSEPSLTLYHGSRERVELPRFGWGNPRNDYGQGFYCTENSELASEWACPGLEDGFVNEYRLATGNLRILDLDGPDYSILNWLAVLVANRQFDVTTPLMREAKEFLLSTYMVDTSGVDVMTGHRADDSYFSFARAFLDSRLSMRQLENALYLGELGQQVVLISPRAFEALTFVDAHVVDGTLWHPRRCARDEQARRDFRDLARTARFDKNDVFMLDLLRRA